MSSSFFSTCGIVPEKITTYTNNHHGDNCFYNNTGTPSAPRMEFASFKENMSFFTYADVYEKLPTRDMKADLSLEPGIRDWWLGHATNLIEINKKFILTDPVFDAYASPIPGIVVRGTPAALSISELPEISYVLISHNHWDHLSKASCKAIYKRFPNCNFFVPLKVAQMLVQWGIKNVTEFDWRTKVTIENITFMCLPTHHGSSRWGVDLNRALWCSWMIESENILIYYSGDTAVGPHFKEINKIYGRGPDLFIVGIGPQLPTRMMRAVHLDGPDALKMAKEIGAVKITPMHYGTFPLGVRPEVTDLQLMLDACTDEEREKLLVIEIGGIIEWNGSTFIKV
jgi:N-acyl-phosphatidylethanolamine-hydrolysing phospholipase D